LNSNIYIPQSPHLKNLVHSVWQTGGITPFRKEHIIPKGIVEFIFNFSDGSPIKAQVGNGAYQLSRSFINGFNKVPVQHPLPEKQMFLGLQLQPLAVKKILGIPAGEFSDKIVDLELVASNFYSLWHQLADQIHFDKRVSIVTSWMEKKLADGSPQENMVNQFLTGTGQHDI